MAKAGLEQLQQAERIAAFAQEPYIPPPSAWLALTEAHRAVAEIITLNLSRRRLVRLAPSGDGHPVMVLPGFMGGMAIMQHCVASLPVLITRYTAGAWGVTWGRERVCWKVCASA